MAHHFGRVSLVSLFANVVALPAVAPRDVAGDAVAPRRRRSRSRPPQLLNALNGYCLAYLSAVAHWSAGLPHAAVDVNLGLPALVGVYAGLVACCALAAGCAGWARLDRIGPRSRAPLIAAAAVIAALIASALAPGATPAPLDRFRVTFLDVGQGDATLLQAPGRRRGAGGRRPARVGVAASSARAGVHSLDLVVLTHAQRTTRAAWRQVVEELPVGVLLDGGAGARDPTHGRIVVARPRRRGAQHRRAAGRASILRAGALRLRVLSLPSGAPVDPGRRAQHHAHRPARLLSRARMSSCRRTPRATSPRALRLPEWRCSRSPTTAARTKGTGPPARAG